MESLIIQKAFIIASIVIAIWCCCLSGMIFGRVRDWNVPEWLKNPLYECPVCSVPYYGTVIYWLFFHEGVFDWIKVILVAMGIATIFVKMKRN